MAPEHWLAVLLAALATFILASGLDDLFVSLVFLRICLRGKPFGWPDEAALTEAPRLQIAVFIPLWQEQDVIRKMLDHNIAANRYDAYDLFLGVYPNDHATLEVVEEAQRRYFHLHIVECPHSGPTSKADCLNWIYQRMLRYEQKYGVHFDIVLTHDAEDLIHPESLRLINYFAQFYDMVQVPVLPLRRPAREVTHGLYCDEFAEFQTKDIPVRQYLGGFLPSNGVGTGYSRGILDRLAAAHGNRVFDPACLTEDYENGYRIHALCGRQIFLPIHQAEGGSLVATREVFPRSFRPAVRQRTRWTMGIALQAWERHGWNTGQRYWFWRDRKGLLGNLVSPLANLLFLYGVCAWLRGAGGPWYPSLKWLLLCTLALSICQLSVRAWCVCRIYGWAFALGVPVRAVWGNGLNCVSTVLAMARYFGARIRRQPLVWLKTEHVYPGRSVLMAHQRLLGEVLVASNYISRAELERALEVRWDDERIGECLMRLGFVTEEVLYGALSLQQNLPLGKPRNVSRHVTRALPARVARKWNVLPFRVAGGELYVIGPDPPSDEMTEELRRFSSLEIRYHLITPTEFEELAKEYLP